MTVTELIAILQRFPPEMEVHWSDRNFGGPYDEPITEHDFRPSKRADRKPILLIHTPPQDGLDESW